MNIDEYREYYKAQKDLYPDVPIIRRMAYDASGNVEYIGYALRGSAPSGWKWCIEKMTYDGSGNLETSTTTNLDQVWDNRASLSYE